MANSNGMIGSGDGVMGLLGEPRPSTWYESRSSRPRLRFGQMYEDSQIEKAALAGRRRVFCIAAAGCTLLDIAGDVQEIVACDINPAQLAYVKCRADGGESRRGDAEQVMAFARMFAPLMGWTVPVLTQFLGMSNPSEQVAFWRARLETRRFRVCFDAMMRAALSLACSSEFSRALPRAFGSQIRSRLERGVAHHPNATNPYIQAILHGDLSAAPPRVLPLGKCQFVASEAAAYLEGCDPGTFDGFTLSNIQDGTTKAYRIRLTAAIRGAASPNAVVVSRSFVEPRSNEPDNRASVDRSHIWGVVKVAAIESEQLLA